MASKHRSASIDRSSSKKGRVEVDQGPLIRKVLARYPGGFTLFRELLQNADDAESEKVEIHFEVDKKTSKVVKYTLKNDGKMFIEEDWNRLKLIASGNPKPGKVGAFGVGFYSVFSVTEHPVVLSGGFKMELFWEGNYLFWLKEPLPKEEKGTTIEIPLREPDVMPELIDFLRFLATSITFMARLKDVQVFSNEDCIGRIKKSDGKLEPVDQVPISLKSSAPLNMTVKSLQCHRFAIQFSSDLTEQRHKAKLDLSVFTIEVNLDVERRLAGELVRCTFKKPDSQIRYSLIYTGKDEFAQDSEGNQIYDGIFQGLRADLDEALHSMIFIGHSTGQTTGIGGHMASQFIPTVERESIDLVNKHIASWNAELLHLGGFLSRAVYELELSKIQTEWAKCGEVTKELRERFVHILKFFTVRPSTPSPKVAERLRTSFHTCTGSPLRLLSSKGIQDVPKIRRFDDFGSKFLKGVPLLSVEIDKLAAEFVKAQSSGIQEIQTVNISDVEKDLRDHTLNDPSFGQLIACLRWILREWSTEAEKLLKVASFQDESGTKVDLSSIRHFIDPNSHGRYIPSDAPLPRSVIPRQIASDIAPSHLQKFLWKEFTVIDWLHHISHSDFRKARPRCDFTQSIEWADRVLCSVSSAMTSWRDVVHSARSLLAHEKCIPTTDGLHLPVESYLPSSHLSDDHRLPIVRIPSCREIGLEMEQLLVALGVRKHLPPQLLSTQKTSDLIKYLVDAADNLTPQEIEELKSAEIFAKEGGSTGTRFCLSKLYPPTPIFRQLRLPLIDLGGRQWQDTSEKVKQILHLLGLCLFPPLEDIMNLCLDDAQARASAFDYLCKNFQNQYQDYDVDDYRDTAFIPTTNTDDPKKPGDVFRDEQWGNLEFAIVLAKSEYPESVLEDLGIQRHPPSLTIIQRLKCDPPSREETARRWFKTLSDNVAIFQKSEIDELSRLPIVPKTTLGATEMLTPAECYLKKIGTKQDLYSKLFHFVDFASGEIFLRACGAKNEPTEEDVARRLTSDPEGFYRRAGYKRFLEELEDLASKLARKSNLNDIIGEMKQKHVLLGVCNKTTDLDEQDETLPLCKPSDILIVDDAQTFQLFADSKIITAPRGMRRELEDFYILLGSRMLTTAIREEVRYSDEQEDAMLCSKYRTLVLDRLPLFLYNYSHLKPGGAASRFKGAEDITVRICGKISVLKSLEVSGEEPTTKDSSVSATVTYEPEQKTIQLWLTRDVEHDNHDLAASLCRVLLGTENRPDVEFLTTCLSEEDVLKRRGYAIDQSSRDHCLNDWKLSASTSETSSRDGNAVKPSGGSEGAGHGSQYQDYVVSPNQPICPGMESLRARPFGTMTAKRAQSPTQVMDQKRIETTIEAAIRACKSGQRKPPQLSFSDQDAVSKFVKSDYCDGSAPVDDRRPSRTIQDVVVYSTQGFTDVGAFIACKQKALTDFLSIINTMAKVYDLPLKTFRIFYDTAAGCIACNDKGTLYLNLQYFEKWHYEHSKKVNQARALSFWYLTLAHEIAHNLVQGHDSEHEFWFLAISDKYMDKFSHLLESPAPA